MSNSSTRRAAASLGGMVMQPPITREAASEYMGAEIPPETWSEVCRAFAHYGFALDSLNASRMAKSKEPTKASWHERQKQTAKALEAALERLQATRRHGDFLREASENYSLAVRGRGHGGDLSADRKLREAFRLTFEALTIIERAEPRDIEIPTEANARGALVREIAEALAGAGITVRASTGRSLDAITDRNAVLRDLTPFEQMLDALGIGEEMTVKSFSEFVRSSISKKTRKGG